MYTSADIYGSNILLREIRDGIHSNIKVPFKPTIYIKAENGDFTGLYGESLKSVQPGSIRETKDFVEKYKNVDGFEIFGQLNYTLQYLNTFSVVEWQFGHVNAYSIDIEVQPPLDENGNPAGFPKPEHANGIVDLITIQNIHTEQCYTWGLGPKPATADTYTRYTQCKDEYSLLKSFVETWEQFGIEIITGWNSNFFDLPYLINRITKICGDVMVKRLSPWGQVRCDVKEYKGKKELEFSIVGVQCIDYIDLMKKFTYGGRESWKLDSIAQEELGDEKLKSPADSLDQMRKEYPDTYVLYNVHDVRLVTKLEKKMKLIELAMTLAYKAKINFEDVYSPVKMWDAIIANKLLSENIVVPQRKTSGTPAFGIEGAYVKTPIPGFYEWVSTLDGTSLYPSLIMTLNISPESYLGMTDSTVDKCVSGFYMNDNPDICMGANGALYDRKKRGIIPRLMEEYMVDRKKAKKEMLSLQQVQEDMKKAGKTNFSEIESKISSLDNLQMALKIALNSAYGGIANAGFRFFNSDMAESITTTGQLYLKAIERDIDFMISKEFKMPETSKFMIYADTDSVMLCLGSIINRYAEKATPDQKLMMLEKITIDKVTPLVNTIIDQVSESIHAYENKMFFKTEIAADRVLLCGKKNYICRVHSSEGVRYAKPKYKTMGVAMVRSSTPKVVQEDLRSSLDVIFNEGEKAIPAFVESYDVNDVARPSSANNIDDFVSARSIYKSGTDGMTPMHIRAALLYNHYIKEMGLQNKYEPIKDGDKVRFINLRKPNPFRENVVGWPADIKMPKEFGLEKYIDWETQFEKTFKQAIINLVEPIGWSVEERATLDEFFG
jgi:DNA polymerase elongation subunit (family B)